MIGVVGDDETASRLTDRLQHAGERSLSGPADDVVERAPDCIVAVGESAVVDLVRAQVEAPVLPVGTGPGFRSVTIDEATDVVDRLPAGDYRTRTHRLLSVEADGTAVGRAVFDVLLVRDEPGRISEYSLRAPATRSRFRADGVIAATPPGSHGYAHAAGGPRLALETAVAAVVPIAAFGLGAPTWILDPADGIELRVERDEGDVAVLLDGREERTVTGRAAMTLTPAGELRTIDLANG